MTIDQRRSSFLMTISKNVMGHITDEFTSFRLLRMANGATVTNTHFLPWTSCTFQLLWLIVIWFIYIFEMASWHRITKQPCRETHLNNFNYLQLYLSRVVFFSGCLSSRQTCHRCDSAGVRESEPDHQKPGLILWPIISCWLENNDP
jgi:hypothetical protein